MEFSRKLERSSKVENIKYKVVRLKFDITDLVLDYVRKWIVMANSKEPMKKSYLKWFCNGDYLEDYRKEG